MKYILNYIFIFGIILTSCNKDENTIPECDVENPLEELEWLKEMKDTCKSSGNICHTIIIHGLYKDESVYYTNLIGALCDPPFNIFLRDCNGDTIKKYKIGDNQKFQEEVEFVEILHTCPLN